MEYPPAKETATANAAICQLAHSDA